MDSRRHSRAVWLAALLLALSACRDRATITRGGAREAKIQVTPASASKAAQTRAERAERPTKAEPDQPLEIPEGVEPLDAAGLQARLRIEPEAHPNVRGTLLNVWASWCGSCKREIPMLLELRKAFAEQGIDFEFLSADEPESFGAARTKMQEWGVSTETLVIAQGALGPVQRLLHPTWNGALPATFLFDAQGKRRYFWEGPMQEHELTPILQAFATGTLQDGDWRPALSAGKTDR